MSKPSQSPSAPPLTELRAQIAAAVAELGNHPPQVEVGALPDLSPAQVAAMIDHTLLKPDATSAQIRRLCAEAQEYTFAAVCVNPTWAALCVELLAGSPVRVCSVAGFPLGATLPEAKALETARLVALGVQEVDMVINVGRLKDGDLQTVWEDIAGVVQAAHGRGALVKVIIETCLLTQEEKVAACVLAQAAGADFVKTSTGFNGPGATVADVALMRQVGGPHMGVKAAGGIRTAADARRMIAAGATRIGASAGVQIVQGFMAGDPAATAARTVDPPGGETY